LSQFIDAVTKGDIERVEEMINSDPTIVNFQNEKGLSALILSTYYGHKNISKLLISRGAHVNLYEAAALGDLEIVKKTLEKEPSRVNSHSIDGFTPLSLASFFGNEEIVAFLLERGADPNLVARNSQKVQALHSSVAHGHYVISKMLISHGANVNAKQEGGFTPLHEAAQSGNYEIAKLLIANGASINERIDSGKTPLGLTKVSGREAGSEEARRRVALLLSEHGALE
jgi:ankyrin repeat protein